MIEVINNISYLILDEEREKTLHKDAFNDTYQAIKQFSEKSQEVYHYISKNDSVNPENLYIHQALCSLPGHGKTTSLEYHMKMEIIQTEKRKNPYLLVFNNKDTMNTFYELVNQFANKYNFKNTILAIDENNIEKFQYLLDDFQIICITQQRLRDLALEFGNPNLFLWYRQEHLYWGRKPTKIESTLVHRTIIIDEMPIFFNSVIFDIGKENNMLDWYDSFVNNTSDKELSPIEKQMGRSYISNLINQELDFNIRNHTLKLNRFIVGTNTEVELSHILISLNINASDNESVNLYKHFIKLLNEDGAGAINNKSKKKILCSDFINYKSLGNILILDGTAKETKTVYYHAGFQIKHIHNYHNYIGRLFFEWCKLNTARYKRDDNKSETKEQIAANIIEKREKGMNILPIPSKKDIETYIKLGAITPEQQHQFFMDRQNEDDSLALNIHNLTGKNDLSKYNHIALLNLPIMQPDYYRLQAIAIYGTDIDLRLVSELESNDERQLYKGKWFIDDRVQNLFIEQQMAELSQIIHRSSIRNINSDEKVTIHMYHNKEQINEMLKGIFNLTDENFNEVNIQKNNNFKVKCRTWAEQISDYLKKNPYTEFTAFKAGGNKFKKWLENYWKEHEQIIRQIFKEYNIVIVIKGKGNYKYFSYVDDVGFVEMMNDGTLEELFS